MALTPGQSLAHYRIVEQIGSGGMGDVYLAEDTKLRRQVALKVLPEAMAGDAERRARFEREAQAIAALNHPNIVTIFSVEEHQGLHFLTMELVAGTTLRQRIPAEGMGVSDLVQLALPLAEALASAHAHGITHRDLKPDNVMVGDDGRVKVLDFGLAKLREEAAGTPEGTALPTASITGEGKILGTFSYMSPEQAEGKPIGPPSDVFSLGVMLYEMSTGKRPFHGDTPISTITAILRDQPPSVTDLKHELPRHLGRVVRRCLHKDPTRRYASAVGLRNELEVLRDEMAAGGAEPDVDPAAPARRRGLPLWSAVALALVAATAAWLLAVRSPAGDGPAGGTALHMSFTPLTYAAGVETQPALSPDGSFVVYVGEGPGGNLDLFLLRVGGRNPINLTPESADDDYAPAFSPDGKFLAFRSDRQGGGLFVMGATGEAVRRLTGFGHNPSWSPDGRRIVFADEGVSSPQGRNTQSGLWLADAESGETVKIFDGDAVQPAWSPGGRRIAYWAVPIGGASSGIRDLWSVAADGSDPLRITDDAAVDWNPVWSADGTYLYFASDRGGSMNLWRVPMDETAGKARGEPEPVTTPSEWSSPFTLARDADLLAYAAVSARSNIHRVEIDLTSGMLRGQPVPVTRGTIRFLNFELSPDGEWLVAASAGRQEDLYLVRRDGTGLRKLTDDLDKDRGPSWSPDGESIVFYSNRGGRYELWTIRTDGSSLRRISEIEGAALWFPEWSPDGTRLAAYNAEGVYVFEVGEGLLRKEDARKLPAYDDGRAVLFAPSWSPDGTRLAGFFSGIDGAPASEAGFFDLRTGTFTSLGMLLFSPTWLADGKRILGSVGNQVTVVDTVSGQQVRCDLGPGADGPAQLAPDGRTLFYMEQNNEADIWLAKLE